MRRVTAQRIVLATALAAAVVAAFLLARHPHRLPGILETIEGWGPWGLALVIVLYLPVCLLLLPSTPLNLASGLLGGVLGGAVAASLGSTLAALVAFLLGRFLLRGWVERRLAVQPRFVALDDAIGSQGLKIVLLLRLCTLFPFGLTSYACGLTRVSLTHFVLGSWLGRLPQILLCAYVGSTARCLAELAAGNVHTSVAEQISLGLGLVATLAIVALLSQIARQTLRDTVRDC